MGISSNYWNWQTVIFAAIFLAVVFISARRKTDQSALSKEASNELRGLAILGILFAHLTYGKFYGTEFLFPLGIWGGVAVNLFLFLSGFGLAASMIYHPKTPLGFYRKRVLKIYLPLWIFLAVILPADLFVLGRFYSWPEILPAFLGYYPKADLFTSINSPLWFLTPLLFYYLAFPFIFKAKRPRLSVLAVFAASLAAFLPWPVSEQILGYYRLHWLTFPIGVLFAALIISPQATCFVCLRKGKCRAYRWVLSAWVKGDDACSKPLALAIRKLQALPLFWRLAVLILSAGLAWQTAYHSQVGRGWQLEQACALLTMLCVILFFIFKKNKFGFLELAGVYSFEIYLWHWPLIGRYGFLYQYLPPWLATALYLPLLLLIAYSFNRLAKFLAGKFFRN